VAARAPTSTGCVPWLLFKSVLVNPGYAELTLMLVPRNSHASCTVSMLSAAFEAL
jgi:hypothetical protein